MLYSMGEGTAQQAYGPFYVVVRAKKYANPAGFGEDVVRLGLSGRDNLVPDGLRKRNIDQAVAMNMPQFPLSQSELHPTEAMRSYGDLVPAAYLVKNTALCSPD